LLRPAAARGSSHDSPCRKSIVQKTNFCGYTKISGISLAMAMVTRQKLALP
jgi:hypothetical protein